MSNEIKNAGKYFDNLWRDILIQKFTKIISIVEGFNKKSRRLETLSVRKVATPLIFFEVGLKYTLSLPGEPCCPTHINLS